MDRHRTGYLSTLSDFLRVGFSQGYIAVLMACSGNTTAVSQQQTSSGGAPIATSSSTGGSVPLSAPSGGSSSATGGATAYATSALSTGGRSTEATGGSTEAGAGGLHATGGTGTGGATVLGGTSGIYSTAKSATGGSQTGGVSATSSTYSGAAGGSQTGGVSATNITGTGGAKPIGGTTNGGAATGGVGTGGTEASRTTGSGIADPFKLAWQDDFNTLDSSRWAAQNFTYDTNLATFTPNNVSVSDGVLKIALTANSGNSTKPYWGVELRSAQTLTYGKLSARMRFAKGSGVVSGLVLFYTPYPNCNWNEIDIEHLGNSSNSSQLNAMVYTGTVMTSCTTSVSPTQDPQVVDLGFDAESDFHQYDVEWTPTSVRYIADNKLLRTWTKNINLLKEPLTILLTIWASSSSSWAGAVNASTAPTSAEIDWIKAYSWNG